MNKWIVFVLCSWFLVLNSCTPQQKNEGVKSDVSAVNDPYLTMINSLSDGTAFFDVIAVPVSPATTLRGLNSFATAFYNNNWIFIGGKKTGFHGTTSSPSPFLKSVANDSIYVYDPTLNQTWGVPVPALYVNQLCATNQLFVKQNDYLYLCGGYTVKNNTSTQFDYTADQLWEINLPQLINYVKSGGTSTPFTSIVTAIAKSPFFQVTGGEMMIVNNNFYLIGGQNYPAVYSAGLTGNYTSSIKKFKINNASRPGVVTDTLTVTDTVNLHRRDFNLVKILSPGNDSIKAIIYGGVFDKYDRAYQNPIIINGLVDGTPNVSRDTLKQQTNLYTCAYIPMSYKNELGSFNLSCIIGGITHKWYNPSSDSLEIGYEGDMLPFSNLVTTMLNLNGDHFFYEAIHTPPKSLLPALIGSNAIFIPLPGYLLNGFDDILDVDKVFAQSGKIVHVGYLYGGILSNGPTSGTTPNGIVNTYVNSTLYKISIVVP